MSKRQKNKATKTSRKKTKDLHIRELLPFHWDKEKNLFYDNEGNYIRMVQTDGTNLFGFKRNDQESYMYALQNVFSSLVGKGQIFSYEVGADVDGYIEDIEQVKQKLNVTKNEQDQIRYQINLNTQERFKYTAMNRDMVDRTFLFIVKDKDLFKLEQRCHEICNCLNMYQKTDLLDSQEMVNVIYNYYHPRNNRVVDRMYSEMNDMMDFIYPDCIEKNSKGFKRQYLKMDGMVMKIKYISLYKQAPPMAFLSYISSLSDVDFSLHFEPAESDAIKKEVSKDIKNTGKNIDKTKEDGARKELELKEAQLHDVLDKIVSESGQPVRFGVTIRVKGHSIEDVEDYSREIDKKLDEFSIAFRDGIYQQMEMFQHNAPICNNSIPEYMKTTTKDVLGWGYPFVFESLYDSVPESLSNSDKRINTPPVYLGNTIQTGGVVFYDNFTKKDDRSNYNEFIVGSSGFGKTFMVMWLIYVRFAIGYKQFIVDVEGKELHKLTHHLHGENVNCSNGEKGRINPLQIRFIIPDDADAEKKVPLSEIKPLSEHIRFTRNFFKAYKGDSNEIGLLNDNTIEDALIECYADVGITLQTTAEEIVQRFKNDDYPIMMDLFNKLNKWLEAKINAYENSTSEHKVFIDEKEITRLKECIAFVKPLACGADASIFNGFTNVNLDNKLICFNISGLSDNTANKVLQTQYYNIMSYIWTSIVSNPEHIRQQIYADEFSVIMDPRNLDIMLFFQNIAKRIRKYFGGLTTATQQIDDVLKDSVKEQGKAIIANSCYEFYFGLDVDDIEYIKNTNMLPESEVEFIKVAKIGQCYAKIGKATAMRVQVTLDDQTLQLFEGMKA